MRDLLVTYMLISFFLLMCLIPAFIRSSVFEEMIKTEYSHNSEFGISQSIVVMLGAAFQRGSFCSLNIHPWVMASMFMGFLSSFHLGIPYFQSLNESGEAGQAKLQSFQKVLSMLICCSNGIVGCYMLFRASNGLSADIVYISNPFTYAAVMIIPLIAVTMMFVWLSSIFTKFTDINGIVLILSIQIISNLPEMFGVLYKMFESSTTSNIIPLSIFSTFIFTIGIIVFANESPVLLPVKYPGVNAKAGMDLSSSPVLQDQHMELRINNNSTNIMIFVHFTMPIISSIISNIKDIFVYNSIIQTVYKHFQIGKSLYILTQIILIIFFLFTMGDMTVDLHEIGKSIYQRDVIVEGCRPMEQTVMYLESMFYNIKILEVIYLVLTSCSMYGVIALIEYIYSINVPVVIYLVSGTSLQIVCSLNFNLYAKIPYMIKKDKMITPK